MDLVLNNLQNAIKCHKTQTTNQHLKPNNSISYCLKSGSKFITHVLIFLSFHSWLLFTKLKYIQQTSLSEITRKNI